MNSGNQLLLFAVAFCLALLVFGIRKVVAETKRHEQTIQAQRDELAHLSLVICAYQEAEQDCFGPEIDDFAAEDAADPTDWDNDLPF